MDATTSTSHDAAIEGLQSYNLQNTLPKFLSSFLLTLLYYSLEEFSPQVLTQQYLQDHSSAFRPVFTATSAVLSLDISAIRVALTASNQSGH